MSNAKVIEVVAAIHKQVRAQAASYDTPVVLEDWANDLADLHHAYDSVHSARNLVGTRPQLPNSLIGIVAGWVTSIVQRALFWYTPQIRHFQESTARTLGRVCSLEERKYRSFLAMADRIEKLEREVRLLRVAQRNADATTLASDTGATEQMDRPRDLPYSRSDIDPGDFYSEFQQRFPSTWAPGDNRFGMYHSVLSSLDPGLPDGKWLDLGCAGGEWLQLTRDKGLEATGVDSDSAAIERCRESGLEVVTGDALEFLRSAGDQSFAVISAFHLLEHRPFDYCLNLVYQAARVLKPGGALLVETPHPGNLLVAAEQFWTDPSRNRPIPLPLMVFLFVYCGLVVANRLEVNPQPEADRLPYSDVELCDRLNLLLYGPRDYALLGRRRD